MQIHRLGEKENIYTVASDYSVSPFKLAVVNEAEMNGKYGIGKELLIPTPTRTYTVKKNDEIPVISSRFGITPEKLYSLNPELYGKGKLYQGQLLTVKTENLGHGMASTNAYYYRGCPESRLELFLPFMNYITVCALRGDGNRQTWLFDDSEILERARTAHKYALLRTYIGTPPSESQADEFLCGVATAAKSKGYRGVTLANLAAMGKESICKFTEKAKERMNELGLTLFAEADLAGDTSYADLADSCILTYEKLHMSPIPDFNSAEGALLTEFAEKHNSERASLDLSAFAFSGGKYIDKNEAIRTADRQKRSYVHNDSAMVAALQKPGKSDILIENMENTKAKLNAVGELGFMGISYDIARTPLYELVMFSEMFKPIERGVYYDEAGHCPGAM